mmetsp:Transcript_29493/g.77324  ORF Transcript_29493/g.77324 Transcript_29493/m.77324 type:complete len:106 (+) Transcript_29493:50-367(+)
MAPAWLHGAIKRSDAESLVGTADGTFLVRRRPAKGGGVVEDEFVLTVVFKGKPTHHGIKRDETGAMCVNGKPHGAKTSVEDVSDSSRHCATARTAPVVLLFQCHS